jgi:methylthioribose-1-phosphate isomerase
MHPVCDDKARTYEVALKYMAAGTIDIALATLAKKNPRKSEVKGVLQKVVENLKDTDLKTINLQGTVDSIENLIQGIDRGDLPVTGDTIQTHFSDIEGNLWDKAWEDVIACGCQHK